MDGDRRIHRFDHAVFFQCGIEVSAKRGIPEGRPDALIPMRPI